MWFKRRRRSSVVTKSENPVKYNDTLPNLEEHGTFESTSPAQSARRKPPVSAWPTPRTRPQSRDSFSSWPLADSTATTPDSRRSSVSSSSQGFPELRKRNSPRALTLRELRAKESEAALRQVYESQTLAYLEDTIQPQHSPSASRRFRWSGSESFHDDTIIEEENEDDPDIMMGDWWTHAPASTLSRNNLPGY